MLFTPNFFFLSLENEKTGLPWNEQEHLLQPAPSPSNSVLLHHLWEKLQEGITIPQMENVLLCLLFLRFLLLAIRYNLKTSFYITCIGSVAGYFWYRHLMEILLLYRYILINLPFFHQLGLQWMEDFNLNPSSEIATNTPTVEKVSWYNPGTLLYRGVKQGIVSKDPITGTEYYIDPFSMLLSSLPPAIQTKILPGYYSLYQTWIPQVVKVCQKYWNEFSGVATYVLLTRLGKRYCPYLIRWHWTCVILVIILEQILVPIFQRMYFFQTQVLLPAQILNSSRPDFLFEWQMNMLTTLVTGWIYLHLGFIFFGLIHAICGQYFYLPFLVTNVELHVGARPTESIYSGGNTPWQTQPASPPLFSRNWASFVFRLFRKLMKTIKKILKF